MEVADWTAAAGFESLEIACWPRATGPTRRYAGTSHIDVANLSAGQATEIVDEIASKGLAISGLGYYPNPLHPDPAHRAEVIGHLKHVITAAEAMGVPLRQHVHGRRRREAPGRQLGGGPPGLAGHRVASPRTTAGRSPSRTARCCSASTSGRAATTSRRRRAIWRRILEQWGGTIGLNFDPSHLILQMIDIPRFIREFGPHILHVQAKDLLIDRDGLYERGVFSLGIGWQIPRLPGLGDVEWGPLFAALYRAGYDGDVIIEHEDRDFEKTDDLIKRGFLLSRDILRPYIK